MTVTDIRHLRIMGGKEDYIIQIPCLKARAGHVNPPMYEENLKCKLSIYCSINCRDAICL